MRYVNYLVIFVVCFFGLVGCLAATNKQVTFTCHDSVMPGDIEKQITVIAQTHQFFLAPPQKMGLWFYSNLKSSPRLYAMINLSSTPEIILGVSIIRGPGTDDKLPPEVLDVFDAIVREVATQFEKSCKINGSNNSTGSTIGEF